MLQLETFPHGNHLTNSKTLDAREHKNENDVFTFRVTLPNCIDAWPLNTVYSAIESQTYTRIHFLHILRLLGHCQSLCAGVNTTKECMATFLFIPILLLAVRRRRRQMCWHMASSLISKCCLSRQLLFHSMTNTPQQRLQSKRKQRQNRTQ